MNSLRFLSDWPWQLGVSLAVAIAGVAWWLYRRETRGAGSPHSWLLPLLRALAIFLLLMTFLEPVIHHRIRQGEPGKITFLIDGSESMSVTDDPRPRSSRTRFERAAELLLSTEHSSLTELANEFEVSVKRLGEGQVSTVWEATAEHVPDLTNDPTAWRPPAWAATSALGDGLSNSVAPDSSRSADGENQTAKSVIVLLSDGQNNSGSWPLEIASQLAEQKQQLIFTVGFGATADAADLSLTAVNYPKRAFRSDVLRGTLAVKEQLGRGQAYTAAILLGDETVWQSQLISAAAIDRSVEFAIELAPLYDKLRAQLPTNAEYAVLPLRLDARLTASVDEANQANNAQPLYLSIAAQRSRLLIVDGRSRWETRYLRNLFDRDPAWQIDTVITSEAEGSQFPSTRDKLFQFDLIVLGDVPADTLSREQRGWLGDFVELSGGGLIVVPGARGHLNDPNYAELQRLLPVKWTVSGAELVAGTSLPPPKRAVLTSLGESLSALRIDPSSETASTEVWRQLPALQFVTSVESLPGSETLVNAVSESETQPLMVTRRFGAGRVLFVATDETWRWRYKVADVVHQRLWNQLARWVMRTPMAVQSEFVSLDCGAASYGVGESIETRVQLRNPDGRPSANRTPTALVTSGGQLIARVPLLEDPNIAGSYAAELTTLPAADYQVTLEAAGFNREALAVHTNFSIVALPSLEMQQVTCDNQVLRGIAERTGGQFLPEVESGQLMSLLHPFSTGRFIESDTVLWQTYWWFSAAMALLVCEWWLRKRAGLV